MKKIKFLAPVLGITTLSTVIAPVMTSCNKGNTGGNIKDNGVEVVDASTKTSQNAYATYECKFDKAPTNGTAKVTITNSADNTIKVCFDTLTSNGEYVSNISVTDKKAQVNVRLETTPSTNLTSKFDLKYEFTVDGQAQVANIRGCSLTYTVNESLQDVMTIYNPTKTPKTGWTSTTIEGFNKEYGDVAVVADSSIFREDMLYSFSKIIDENRTSFDSITASAQLNNVRRNADNKYNVNITFKIKGKKIAVSGYTFENIDCQFNLETVAGYKITSFKAGTPYPKIRVDGSDNIIGTLKGSFKYSDTYGTASKTITNYSGEISSSYAPVKSGTDKEYASTFGCYTLAFLFDFDIFSYGFYSPFARNFSLPQ